MTNTSPFVSEQVAPSASGSINWIQTDPGKSWFPILRLYGPLEPWLDKTWRPSELQRVT